MAALTLLQLRTLTRDLVGDPDNGGTGANTYSDSMMNDAINWAVQYVCTRMGYTYKEALIIQAVSASPLVFSMAGAVNTAGTSAPINDYLVLRRVMTGGKPNGVSAIATATLIKSSEAEEDLKSPTWRGYTSATIAPKRWLLLDGTNIMLVPTPTVGNSTTNFIITVGYSQKPTDLSANGDTVDSRIPWPVQNYLKYAAGSWLRQMGGQDLQSLQESSEWLKVFNDFVGLES